MVSKTKIIHVTFKIIFKYREKNIYHCELRLVMKVYINRDELTLNFRTLNLEETKVKSIYIYIRIIIILVICI